MKKVMILGLVLLVTLASCNSRSGQRRGRTPEPIGEVTLYYPNGTDTTIVVSDVGNPTTHYFRYDTMDGIEHRTTVRYIYKEY